VVLQQVKEQLPLWGTRANGYDRIALRDAAAAENKSKHVHRWAPWIAGFSATFVQDVIDAYLPRKQREHALVLDPFAGVGTTLVEALKTGCNVQGYEINGFAAMAARAKTDSIDVDVNTLSEEISSFRTRMIAAEVEIDRHVSNGDDGALAIRLDSLRGAAPKNFRSRIPFFSAPVEAKFLYGLTYAQALGEPDRSLFLTALGATMVSFSNYTYEPSLGSRPGAGKSLVENASVRIVVCQKLAEILEDIQWAQENYAPLWAPRSRTVQHASYFESTLRDNTVSLVVTSPPYMNNYHYVRNTRPQLHWLGLVSNAVELKELERRSFGKFWQVVRQGPRLDLAFDFPELQRALDHLRNLNPEKGHYGGRGWANYVASYFNDSYLFLQKLRRQLRPGGRAVIVVGNSIIQGMEFRVDHLLAQVAERSSIEVEDVRVVRTKRVGNSIIDSTVRNGQANGHGQKTQLYDAAVILRG
jgi:SAM-dependent methyltransferase